MADDDKTSTDSAVLKKKWTNRAESDATFPPSTIPVDDPHDYLSWAEMSGGWKQLRAAVTGGAAMSTDVGRTTAARLVNPDSLMEAGAAFERALLTLQWLGNFMREHPHAIAGEGKAWQGPAADPFLKQTDYLAKFFDAQAERIAGAAGTGNLQSIPQQLYDGANALAWAQYAITYWDQAYAQLAREAGNTVGADGLVSITGTPLEKPDGPGDGQRGGHSRSALRFHRLVGCAARRRQPAEQRRRTTAAEGGRTTAPAPAHGGNIPPPNLGTGGGGGAGGGGNKLNLPPPPKPSAGGAGGGGCGGGDRRGHHGAAGQPADGDTPTAVRAAAAARRLRRGRGRGGDPRCPADSRDQSRPGGGDRVHRSFLAVVLAPRGAVKLAGLRGPQLPKTGADMQYDIEPDSSDVVRLRAGDADTYLVAVLGASGLLLPWLFALTMRTPGWSGWTLVAVISAAVLLRARSFFGLWHRIALVTAGTVGCLLVIGRLSGSLTGGGRHLLLAGLAAVFVPLIMAAMRPWPRRMLPFWEYAATVLDVVTAVAVLPVLAQVLDLYGWARGLLG